MGALPAHWWAALADPTLDALVARALSANPDLAESEARLRSARANLTIAKGRELPSVNLSGSATKTSRAPMA